MDARIHIDGMPLVSQLAGQLTDVDAHAPGVLGSQVSHRATVSGEYRNF